MNRTIQTCGLFTFLSAFLIKIRCMFRTYFPYSLLGSDKASAQYTIPVIKYRRLPGGDSRSLRSKLHQQVAVIRQLKDLARNRTAPVSDAHRKIRTGQEFFDIRSHGRFYQHVFSLQLVGIPQHHRILFRIDFQHVCRFSQSDAQPFPLPDGVIGESFVLP